MVNDKARAVCLMQNCSGYAPPSEPFCSTHRDRPPAHYGVMVSTGNYVPADGYAQDVVETYGTPLPVEQRHRDAAANYLEDIGSRFADDVLLGKVDHSPLVQAFAEFEHELKGSAHDQ